MFTFDYSVSVVKPNAGQPETG